MNCSGRNIYLCAAGLLILVESFAALLGSPMPSRIIQGKEFLVVGIEARTNNAKESTGDGIIPKQWSKFFAEGILSKIPNKVDPTIFAVYTDYASDRNGDYTFLIGAKVSAVAEIPAGMVTKIVPAGRYALITSATGPVQSVAPQAWQQIWGLEDRSQLGGVRSYKADFEVYDQRSRDPQSSQVDVCIGIR
jgi:predicted transcriptional regulator YdeE